MYSLDINFVKDRPEYKLDQGKKPSKQRPPASDFTKLYLGLAAGLLLPAVVGSGWLFLQNKNSQLEQNVAKLDENLNKLGIQEQEIKKIQEDANKIKAETQALATVFNQIRPWSAILQDIRDRTPVAVQIESIKQTAAPAAPPAGQPAPTASAAPAGQPAPNPVSGIEVSGVARSFNDVNDFLLTLQQSPFFKPTDTRIVTAELIDNPIQAAVSVSSDRGVPLKLPQVVRYTMQSSLSDAQASELLRELERKGALGLVTRIRTLQKRGIIQQ